MLKFTSLGSGSTGNATLVQAGDTLVLVDSGFAMKELVRRMAAFDLQPEQLSAVLVTHEHGDHLRGVAPLARRYQLPVWMTYGTYRASRDQDIAAVQLFHAQDQLQIGDLQIQAFPVPHDAAEACQFRFDYRQWRLGLLTDTGSITPHIVHSLQACDALILECNHDAEMLRDGPYPYALQQRVGGAYGHLENQQSAALLAALDVSRLQHLWLAHLSERNNHPDKARASIAAASTRLAEQAQVLSAASCSEWAEIA